MNSSIWKMPRMLILKKQKHLADSTASAASHMKNTYLRSVVIGPHLIGQQVHVHNGRRFIPVTVTEDCVGFKLGQFALTKKRVFHKKKKKK